MDAFKVLHSVNPVRVDELDVPDLPRDLEAVVEPVRDSALKSLVTGRFHGVAVMATVLALSAGFGILVVWLVDEYLIQ